ncbi:hypothetical protein PF008_g27876 [Phytophthora fragariae]|uniref:Uncharacterized protein n=1 Tax=Phytophthora fragariae TaxID=53985 RepID=A0A6G0QDM0_9STRA|nr:hypothetical protein PF008_g27876 [Phytophthora fragariae]
MKTLEMALTGVKHCHSGAIISTMYSSTNKLTLDTKQLWPHHRVLNPVCADLANRAMRMILAIGPGGRPFRFVIPFAASRGGPYLVGGDPTAETGICGPGVAGGGGELAAAVCGPVFVGGGGELAAAGGPVLVGGGGELAAAAGLCGPVLPAAGANSLLLLFSAALALSAAAAANLLLLLVSAALVLPAASANLVLGGSGLVVDGGKTAVAADRVALVSAGDRQGRLVMIYLIHDYLSLNVVLRS